MVGVNDFVEEAEAPVEILRIGDEAERTQRARMARLRATRDARPVDASARRAPRRRRRDQNMMPAMLDCARAYCTLYEIREVLERVYGGIASRSFSKATAEDGRRQA